MPPLEFRLLGFPVEVRPAFLLLLGLYALLGVEAGQAAWQIFVWWAVVFGSILLHELGHAGASAALGVEVFGIRLHGFGGEVTHRHTSAGRTLCISLAGPGVGLSLGLLLYFSSGWGFAPQGSWQAWVLAQLLWVNIGWSLLNLLPMRPLDGGQALMSGLWLLVPAIAVSVASAVGLLCAAGLISFGIWLDAPFILLFGFYAVLVNGRGLLPRDDAPRA